MVNASERTLETYKQQLQNNLCRALINLGRHVEITTIAALREKGHHNLAMAYGSPMAILGNSTPRVTEFAEMLGMSKQLCLQTLRPFEEAGYICREPDPDDGRAKRVRLSNEGRRMIKQGLRELDKLSKEYEKVLGERKLQLFSKTIGKIAFNLSTQSDHLFVDFRQKENPLPSYLVRIAQQVEKRILQELNNKNFQKIKIAQSRILLCLINKENRIQQLAELNGISHQSVARIVRGLESTGLILREKDPKDHRNKLISLTTEGHVYLAAWNDASITMQETLINAAGLNQGNESSSPNQIKLFIAAINDLYNHFHSDAMDLEYRIKPTKNITAQTATEELIIILAMLVDQLESDDKKKKALTVTKNKNVGLSADALKNLGRIEITKARLAEILADPTTETQINTLREKLKTPFQI